jgi:hypothetical protein
MERLERCLVGSSFMFSHAGFPLDFLCKEKTKRSGLRSRGGWAIEIMLQFTLDMFPAVHSGCLDGETREPNSLVTVHD